MSKNIDQKQADTITQLQLLGLSEKEASVYLALLPKKDVGSSKLIYATGLHKQFVYNALSRLEELGLVKYVISKGRKKFSANPPQRILTLIEEKKLTAQVLVKQLQKQFAGGHEQDVEVFQGDSAFCMHQMNLLERASHGGTIDVIASNTERYKILLEEHEVFDEYERIRLSKNISIRYLGSESQLETLKQREKNQKLWEYRIIPGHSTGLLNTDIWNDNVTFNIFGDPTLSISISGKEIAEGHRQFFETLWRLGKK